MSPPRRPQTQNSFRITNVQVIGPHGPVERDDIRMIVNGKPVVIGDVVPAGGNIQVAWNETEPVIPQAVLTLEDV